MQAASRNRCIARALVPMLSLAGAAASAEAPAPDTSAWKCSQCPFFEGYSAEVEAGAVYPNDANFSYGRYTGLDESKVYPTLDAAGQYRGADGTNVSYNLEHVGLPYGDGSASFGHEGRYDLKAEYDLQPTRLFETGATPYLGVGTGNITLPANWVAAGSTGGMTALPAALSPVKLEYDRRTAALLGSYIASSAWTFHAELRHQEKDGTGLIGGSFFTEATQLPQRVDYVTDTFEAGVRWTGRRTSIRLTYTGSWFKDNTDALIFANPYLPIVPGSTQGQLSLPPNNNLQQLALNGTVPFDWRATTLTFAASLGKLRQDASFLPYSTLPGSTIPSSGSLDGNVHLSHYSLGIASMPLPKLSVRGTANYDGRDDHTTPQTLGYILTDTFPGSTAVTPRYNIDRTRLDGSADYALTHWVSLGIGGRYLDTYYWPNAVVNQTRDYQSYGRAILTPTAGLSLILKGGNASRTTSAFNAAALPPAENPTIAAYNYAPRDRTFYEITGSWAATAALTWSIEGFFANDDYRLSQLGLQSVEVRRGSSTLTWTPREGLSAYLSGGYERLASEQNGSAGTGTAPWAVSQGERFWDVSVGGQWAVSQRWTVAVDYTHAPSYYDTETQVSGVSQPFPENTTTLNNVRLDLRYQWTRAVQVHLLFIHEKFDSSDWAIQNVGPATVPNLLAFGVQPLNHDVNLVGLTARYQFDLRPPAPAQ